MKVLKFKIYAICIFFPTLFFGQVNISQLMKPSEIANEDSNALYFVDFWATWCAPCIHVSKYLTVLQEQYPDDFYIVSLTDENPQTVQRFLKKHKTKLAIAIDYKGETFKKYRIKSLPEGILFNSKGDILWKGHPADFKTSHIEKFLRRNKKQVAFKDIFNVKEVKYVTPPSFEKTYIPNKDFEIFEIAERRYSEAEAEISYGDDYLEIKGTLTNILAYAFKTYANQIKLDKNLDRSYQVYVKRNVFVDNHFLEELINQLGLEYKFSTAKGYGLILKLNEARFWDRHQISWGTRFEKYLIDDSQIEADNVSFDDLKYRLSLVTELPVIVEGNYDKKPHDWQIHYKYFELMKNNLQDNYGISIVKELTEYPIFEVIKKAF